MKKTRNSGYEAFDRKRQELERQTADEADLAVLNELQEISQSIEAVVKDA